MSCTKLRVLGSGSYGTVFLGEPFSFFSGNPVFAVKSSELRCSDSLQAEAQFLETLNGSPFIVRAFGDDISVENRKQMYNLLLEYAPGGTLKNLIDFRGGNFSEQEVLYYAYQLLRGIHDVHRGGIVHCDLKPDNVLIFPCKCGCGRNCLKIADFGLAKFAGGENNMFGDNHRGTLMYTSPESLTHKMYEAQKDIWAVGCIIVEMITGRPIWNSIFNEGELKFNIAFKEPEIPDGISFLAKDFLEKCFESDPYSRRTTEVLLAHPFFANDKFNVCGHLSEEVENPFGSRGWSSHTYLFSTRSIPEPSSDFYDPFLAKDFLLKRCFENNPYSRQTAEVLPDHPFVANDEFNVFDNISEEVKNPFGSGEWYFNSDLFSTRSIPEPSSDSYKFFQFINMAMGEISMSFIPHPRPISTPNIYQRHVLPQFPILVLGQ